MTFIRIRKTAVAYKPISAILVTDIIFCFVQQVLRISIKSSRDNEYTLPHPWPTDI